MNDSTKKYIDLVAHIDEYSSGTDISAELVSNFQATVKIARKVIVTGTGTSLPTAQYLATRLRNLFPALPIYFLPTAKAIRAADHANRSDLFIVVSYGLNRADSLIILEKASQRCKSISISGNREASFDNNLNIIVPPKEERIFCRPVSPLTTLIAIEKLCGGKDPRISPITGLEIPEVELLSKWLDPNKQTIVLYTADVSFSAELWGIVLREGAGMNVSIKDMENYSHGYYGPDTAHLDDRQYIIMKSDSIDDERDFNRAKGLYEVGSFNKFIVTARGDMMAANKSFFRAAPELIARLLTRTNYDMYAPNGMEENRRYHEYEYYKNY